MEGGRACGSRKEVYGVEEDRRKGGVWYYFCTYK
jgi:hypothetical protein